MKPPINKLQQVNNLVQLYSVVRLNIRRTQSNWIYIIFTIIIIENFALTRLLHQVYCRNKLCQITDCVINLLKKVLERKSIINDELLTSKGSMSYVLKGTVLPIFCCFNDLLIANPVNCRKRSPLVFASQTSLAKNTTLENI